MLADALGDVRDKHRHLHEVRVRLLQQHERARRAEGAAAGLLAEACPLRGRGEPEAARARTTSTSTRSTTRACGRCAAMSSLPHWKISKSEGKIRHYGAALGPANGWEPEGLALMRERGIDSAADDLQHARAGSGRQSYSGGGGARCRRAACACRTRRGCSRASTRRNDVPGERPPQPSAEGVADRGPAEARAARVP